jgi:lysophospholipase L1-like esterase
MKKIKFALLLIAALLFLNFFQQSKIRVFLIGDSTMADKPLADNPERGWGQMFPMFFNDQIEIENFAKNGRSTKSFIDEGRWKTVYDKLHQGDYVFIQFGHNDEKEYDSTRYAAPHTTYKANLLKFISESKMKGATPVLITPVARRKFDDNNKLVKTHGDYPAVVREVAKEQDIPLVDLEKRSEKFFSELGPEKTKEIFLWVSPGEYKSLPKGKEDNTHFQQDGAIKIAELVIDGMKELDLPLNEYLKNDEKDLYVGKNKIVGLDYYFNNEWKDDKEGKKIRYHYIWEDEENSGYSKLGRIITLYDAGLEELTEAPTKTDLDKLSIYFIVDPDTKQESPDPHFIDNESIKNIVNWVEDGGVLVLFANDKGNSEFEHLNNLSEKFGIHFNGDSRNRVIGKEFDMGKFDKFPDQPIFKNVKKIYLKEISTLELKEPAQPVLTDSGYVIMASSNFGKGFVFAVGDPWVYNEYIDNNKLPVGFENYKAAENLFKWLLEKAKTVVKK